MGCVDIGLYVCGDGLEAGLFIANGLAGSVQPDCEFLAFVLVDSHEQRVRVARETLGEHFGQLLGHLLHCLLPLFGALVLGTVGASCPRSFATHHL
jgi:hypothetical protein